MGVCFCRKDEKTIEGVIERLALSRRSRVLVKPNLVSQEPYPTTTDPFVLEVVLRSLIKVGCEVVMADGPAPDKSPILEAEPGTSLKEVAVDFWGRFQREYHRERKFPKEVASLVSAYIHQVVFDSELAQVAGKYRVEVREIGGFHKIRVRLGGLEARMADLAYFDLILNLPVLKLHTICGFTGALKNLYGLVDEFDKMRLHVEASDLTLAIKDLYRNVTPQVVTVMDATRVPTAQERVWGDFRVLSLNTMICGDQMVEVDALALKLLERCGLSLPSNGLIRFLREYSPCSAKRRGGDYLYP